MLEPQAENPKVLLEHHRRRAALSAAAGDSRAAYWHGRKAQAILRLCRGHELEEEPERPVVAFDAKPLEAFDAVIIHG